MKNKEFLKSLSAIADQLRRTIEAEVVGFESTPAAIAERRAKVFDPISGFEYFVYTYFPHYVHTAEKSQLHEFLFTRLPEVLREPKGVPEATGAPRGDGKKKEWGGRREPPFLLCKISFLRLFLVFYIKCSLRYRNRTNL